MIWECNNLIVPCSRYKLLKYDTNLRCDHQMTKVVFRTAAGKNIGIGHLMRCLHLVRKIEEFGGTSVLILDHLPDELSPFLKGYLVVSLYGDVKNEIDSEKDAELFLKHCGEADWVFLDDYRIGKHWEEYVSENSNAKLCVIDDLLRPHQCDAIIDVGSRSEANIEAWLTQLPADAHKMIGPRYTILSKHYQQDWRKLKRNEPFSVLISLGGTGDMGICAGIAGVLLETFEKDIQINIMIGPLAKGRDALMNQFERVQNVNCLTGVTEAYPLLKETDLYIGAAGTTLLQLRSLNIPALTFSIADNQRNDVFNMEKIGHYFHLNNWSEADYPMIARFAQTVCDNYDAILRMGDNPRDNIDGLGSRRIAAFLCDKEMEEDEKESLQSEDETLERLANDYAIRPVRDTDINLYRHSRNLDNNHKFMTLVEKIPAIGHYNWWFNNNRESFLLEKKGSPSLIIWHNRVQADGQEFMNAGWFVCNEQDADFKDVLLAMNWQTKYCQQHHAGLPWLSVVKKDNTFAKQVDDYFGFEEMDENHPQFDICQQMFSFATKEDFHYIMFDGIAKRQRPPKRQ